MPAGWAGQLSPCVAPAAQYIARTGGGFDIGALQEWDGAPFGVDPAVDLPRWQALARVLLTAGGDLRARPTKTQGFEAKSAYKDAFLSWLESARPGAGLPPPPWLAALGDIRTVPAHGYTDRSEEHTSELQ